MYTVGLDFFLQMTELKAHEEMMTSNLLVEFHEGLGSAMFLSHQWLADHHPDPNHEQLRVFQDAMRNLMSGVTRVTLPVAAELLFGRLPCPTADDFKAKPIFVWYDYLCCPQGVSSTSARQRHAAIRSIPSYVTKCEYFVVLCPTVERADNSEILGLATWAARGWCRTERLARELSARKGGYTIVVECSKQQALYMDALRILDAPGTGIWSRESDKAAVGNTLVQMVWNKLLFLLERRDFPGYRFLLNRQGACCFNGLPVEPVDSLIPGFVTVLDPFEDAAAFAVEWFLHHNGFRTVLERDPAGWSPLCYAVIRGDVALVQGLLQRRADPNDQVTKGKGSLFPGRMPVLALAAHFHHNQVMETLIAARASTHHADVARATPVHWASLANNANGLRMLCEARADLMKQNVLGMSVFDMACCNGAVESMAEILAQNPEMSMRFGLHFAVMFLGGHEKPIQWLIHAKADLEEKFEVQRRKQPEWWVLIQMSSLRHRISPSRWTTLAYHHSKATPLMFTILTGNCSAATLLLKAGARTDTKNARGKTALDMAEKMKLPKALIQALRGGSPPQLSCVDDIQFLPDAFCI